MKFTPERVILYCMHKILTFFCLSILLATTACGTDQATTNQINNDNKNVVNVNISKELLEAIQGKSSGDPSKTPSKANPSATPSDSPSPLPSISPSNKPDPDSLDLSTSEKDAILQVVDDNAKALNSQDIDAFSDTVHPDSEFAQYMPDLFYYLLNANTQYEIVNDYIDTVSGNSASVIVYRRTTDVAGTVDQEIVYTLRKDGSDWKIFNMIVTNQSSVY